MAKNDNLKDFVIDVANAIRSKTGKTDPINPQDFSAEIANLSVSGGSKFDELVDGTITELTRQDLANVDTIRPAAFMATPLSSVEIPSNVKTINASAFTFCTLLKTLTIDDGVEEIGSSAFSRISASVINIPSTLSVLETEVFADNVALTSITIPENITEIKAGVFSGCTNLTEVTMESMTPPSVTSTSFPSNVTAIYVKYGAYDTYKAQWTDYADKIVRLPAIPSTITVIVNNYLNELVNGASVTITGNGQTYTGTTNENGVFTQGDLQPATYTISVADLDGFKTPDSVEVVVEENTQNSAIITYLEKPSVSTILSENTWDQIIEIAETIANNNMTKDDVFNTYGWSVGDTTTYTQTNGKVVDVRLIGVNHDKKSDGSGTAGLTFETVNCVTTATYGSAYTGNGYDGSTITTQTLPNCQSLMPTELKKGLKYVDKTWKRVYSEDVQKISQKLFLLSKIEITGDSSGIYGSEGKKYAYYPWYTVPSGSEQRIKTYDGSPIAWWLRSFYETYKPLSVGTNGNTTSNNNTSSILGIAFAFCV